MWLIIIKDNWKKLAVILTLIILFGAGYYYGKKSVKPEVQIITKTIEKEVEVEKTSRSTDHIVTKITKKDGTTIVKTEDKASTVKSETKIDTKENDKTVTPIPPASKNWKVGLLAEFQPSLQTLTELKKPDLSYSVTASRRIIWGVWADAQYNWVTKTVGAGLSIEF